MASEAPTKKKERIEISALPVQREVVTITHKGAPKGEDFELRNSSDFGPESWQEIGKQAEEMGKLYARKERLKGPQRKKLDGLLNTLASQIIIGASPALVQQIEDEGKWIVVQVFLVDSNARLDKLPKELTES